jgi:hypothetical protein
MRIVKPEELREMLERISAKSIPAAQWGMGNAVLHIEGVAKKYCTPGQTPYYKAPYTDDNDPHREPPHMRDVMYSRVRVSGNKVQGTVGNPKHYSPWVHDGSSYMEARPFILDAIIASREDTFLYLQEAEARMLEEEWK